MKIAILAPVAWRTPPKKYGPWEQVASNIAEGLVNKDIDVTLFATKDSNTRGTLEAICDRGYEEDTTSDPKVHECMHISYMMEKADQFDLIHNNFDFLPLTYSRLIKTPMLTTIHGFSSPKIIPVYQRYNDINNYVSISNADRSPKLDYLDTVYNGVNIENFSFNPDPGEYLLFFGRIHHDKGTKEAIDIAKKSGMKLIISGLIQDQEYFDKQVKPHIDNESVIYIGNSSPTIRDKIMGEAYALLHPINFNEPFGLTVIEAMLCGTPVIAIDRGSMSELIVHQKTGFLVENVTHAIQAVKQLDNINRKDCRQWAAIHFSQETMVENYLLLYKKILSC